MGSKSIAGRRRVLAIGAGLVSAAGLPPWSRAAMAGSCATDDGAKEFREALHYVEASENPRQLCKACMYFTGKGRCGTCEMMKRTAVNPMGSCDAWVSKT